METGGPLRLQRYFTPYEVAQHNTAGDCWVSFLGGVYDLTRLIQEHPGSLTEPILAAAGTDISHWFDPQNGDVKTHIDPHTHLPVPYCPKVSVCIAVLQQCCWVTCFSHADMWQAGVLWSGLPAICNSITAEDMVCKAVLPPQQHRMPDMSMPGQGSC
eukprot:GHUV01045806.1.p1 GENE.GHUV01045806.1~~GHUV01045806.1.p1  ORF type:complete len:158 (+),score=21.13 GHUV01045806.1:241-714(+)